jgi:hypothetical protein
VLWIVDGLQNATFVCNPNEKEEQVYYDMCLIMFACGYVCTNECVGGMYACVWLSDLSSIISVRCSSFLSSYIFRLSGFE